MNSVLLVKGLIELGISFCASIIVLIISFKFFTLLTRGIDDVEEIFKNNVAVGILAAAFLFGIMICMRQAINSSMDNLSVIFSSPDVTTQAVIFSVIRIVIFFLLSAIFGFIVLWLALLFYTIFTTKVKEWEEIRKNNVAVALIMGMFLVITALFLSGPLATLLDGLIPPPMILPTNMIKTQPLFNTGILIRGAVELCVTLAGVFVTFLFSFSMFKVLTRKIDETKEILGNNIAMAILLSSFVLGIMILFQSAIQPANQTLLFAFDEKTNTVMAVIIAVAKILGFFAGTAIVSFILLQIAMRIYMLVFSKKDELDAIKNNNIAVAIVVGVFIVSVSLLFGHGINAIISAFISAPKVGPGIL